MHRLLQHGLRVYAAQGCGLSKQVLARASMQKYAGVASVQGKCFATEASLKDDLSSGDSKDFKGHDMLAPFTAGWQTTELDPLVIEKSEGSYVYDTNGKKYLDSLAGLWCTALGGSEPRLVDAATKQLKTLPFYHSFWNRTTKPSLDLATELLEMFTASKMAKVFFTNSGSEANDSQVKLVWYYNNALGRPNKKKFIARTKSYHGSTLISASLTGLPALHNTFDLPAPFILHTDCPHYWRYRLPGETEEEFSTRLANNLENLIIKEGPETIAAFIAEPVMGAGGVIPPPATYFEKIQAVIRKYDILFIADEVVCAFGRLGTMFGCDKYGVKPDLVTLAKALSSAYVPIGAILMSQEIYDVVHSQSNKLGSFSHGFTYSGHPVACAVALEALKIYKERNIVDHVNSVGPKFQEGLKAFSSSPIIGEIRGTGLILGTEFSQNKSPDEPFPPEWGVGAYFGAQCQENGMLVRVSGDGIMMSPPLIITPEEVDERAVLEPAMQGRDMIGRARTGTGKTLAFGIPIMDKIIKFNEKHGQGRNPLALILAPTRELARQVDKEFYESAAKLDTLCVYGGVPISRQMSSLDRGVDVVVGTPGRVIDLIKRGALNLSEVQFVVLDEADQMLNVGFAEDVETILGYITQKHQTMMFSATMPKWILQLTRKFLKNPVSIDLVGDSDQKLADGISLYSIASEMREKPAVIGHLVTEHAKEGKCIVFTQTKRDADRLAIAMQRNFKCEALHGDISQNQRERTLSAFRDGRFNILVATDVAARGLDVPNVDLIIHYELPNSSEIFVHRSGRTGRAGKKGTAILMYLSHQLRDIKSIERDVGCRFVELPKVAVDVGSLDTYGMDHGGGRFGYGGNRGGSRFEDSGFGRSSGFGSSSRGGGSRFGGPSSGGFGSSGGSRFGGPSSGGFRSSGGSRFGESGSGRFGGSESGSDRSGSFGSGRSSGFGDFGGPVRNSGSRGGSNRSSGFGDFGSDRFGEFGSGKSGRPNRFSDFDDDENAGDSKGKRFF